MMNTMLQGPQAGTPPQSLPEGYELIDRPPTLEQYLMLRKAAGLPPKTPEQVLPAITNSWAFCVVAYTPPSNDTVQPGTHAKPEIVGMVRAIGDGGWYFVISDMAVFPTHQHRGIGAALLERILDRIKAATPPGALITLLANAEGRALYRKFGFVNSEPRCVGMWMVTERQGGENSAAVRQAKDR